MTSIDRREFLRRGGRAALAAGSFALLGGAVGCTTERSAGKTTISTTSNKLAGPKSLDELATSLDGLLVLPDEPTYETARLVYDLRFADAMPSGIAYCANPTDVARCVSFACANELAPIPRCGGHSYGGYSTGSGLVIDVTMMNAATFDTSTNSAVVGAGMLLVDLYAACASAGSLIPGGSCPTVGIAGLALGGGVGVVGRKYGLTCDNLQSVELVTADGRVRLCSEGSDEDLFWACRGGGGGNFGIATSFSFRTSPIPSLTLFTIDWPWERASSVLGAWQDWMADAPDELWSNCQLLHRGSAGPLVRSSGVYVGTSAVLDRLLAPFLAAGGNPTYQTVDEDSYLHTMLVEAGCDDLSVAQCHFQDQTTAGILQRSMFTAKSAYVSEMLPLAGTDAAISAISDLEVSDPNVGAALIFDAYGGAIGAVASDATAFVHRDALFAIETSMSFSPDAGPDAVDAGSGWLEATAAALSPYCNGQAYQNYIDPTLANWQSAYYGANLPRLSAVKRTYDPDDVFRFAQSIPLNAPTEVASAGA